ncbi:MAG: ATP-binding cassette domain-containing protein [Eggerthellaceae bacterium]
MGHGFQQPARFKGMKVKKLLVAAGKRLPALECNEYLAKVGLCSAAYLTREVDKSLSGGEVKRIEIATMLARDPKMAIYDEPEAGIDLWSFDRLTETFRDIHETRDDRSIVIISHQERIIQLADDIVCLRDGRIRDMGPREEILPKLGFTDRGFHGCQLTQPTELHLTEISTNC